MSDTPSSDRIDGVGVGVLMAVALNLATVVCGFVVGDLLLGDYGSLVLPGFIGLTQFVWVAPAALILWLQRRWATLKGVAIVAAITFLLNMTCYGLIMIGG